MEHINENAIDNQCASPPATENPGQVAERSLLVDLAVKAAEGGVFGAVSTGAGLAVKAGWAKVHGQGAEAKPQEPPPDAAPPT